MTNADGEVDIDEALANVKETTVGWRFHAHNPLGWWCCMFEWLLYSTLATSLRLFAWWSGTMQGDEGDIILY
jgi:hypothetical protein